MLLFTSLLVISAIMLIMNNLIQSKLELLPTSPGCYIHKDKKGTIIYVGKAKNLSAIEQLLFSWES